MTTNTGSSHDMKGAPPSYQTADGTNVGMVYPNQQIYLGQPGQPPTVTILQPVVYGFSHYPQSMQCPRCQQQIVTVVKYVTGGATWLIAALICVFGGIFGCCLIPFCMNGCQDAIHSCPSCGSFLGQHKLL